MKTRRPILYATDLSDASRPAFAAAVDRARRERAPLVLLYVATPPVMLPEDSMILPRTYQELEATAIRAAKLKLGVLAVHARKVGVRATTVVTIGVPFEQIVRTARRVHAGLVVVGTHGRTGFARLFLGSVAARVVALAPCPVLTVHPPARARRGAARKVA